MNRYRSSLNNFSTMEDDMKAIKTLIKKTQLYQYYKSHPANDFFKTIMKERYTIDCVGFLIHSYTQMLNEGMENIILEIIDKCDSVDIDPFAIGTVSIIGESYSLLTVMYIRGHKLDQESIIDISPFNAYQYDTTFLATAIIQNNLNMCRFLIDHEIDLCNDQKAIKMAISSDNDEIFGYFMSFDCNIDQVDLQLIFYNTLVLAKDKRVTRINALIEKGLDLNNGKCLIYLGGCDSDEIQYLMSHGLIINNELLVDAFSNDNIKLIDFLVDYGLKFDKYITKKIIDNNIHCMVKILNLMIKYDCDFTLIKPSDIFLQALQCLRNNGFDNDILFGYIIETKSHKTCQLSNWTGALSP